MRFGIQKNLISSDFLSTLEMQASRQRFILFHAVDLGELPERVIETSWPDADTVEVKVCFEIPFFIAPCLEENEMFLFMDFMPLRCTVALVFHSRPK